MWCLHASTPLMCEMPKRDGGEEDMEEKGRKRIFFCLPEDKRLHMETEEKKT